MKDILCLPCESSFINPVEEKHPDWELIACPVCGQGCYTSPSHKRTLELYPNMTATCTQCALRGGNAVLPRRIRDKNDGKGC